MTAVEHAEVHSLVQTCLFGAGRIWSCVKPRPIVSLPQPQPAGWAWKQLWFPDQSQVASGP